MKVFLSEFRLYVCNNLISNIPSHTIRLLYYRKIMGFKIGNGSTILMKCKFYCAKGFEIGKYSVINANCIIDSRGGLKIGHSVSISEQVVILTADHDPNSESFTGRKKEVVIENYAWLGTRSTILPGVIINVGAVVAAGAVVHKSIEPFNIVGGVPAKFLKLRNKNLDYNINYKRLFQ